jgi:hypothetical protein
LSGSNTLVSTNTPSVGHGAFQINLMNECGRLASLVSNENPLVVGVYPNPSFEEIIVQLINKIKVHEGNWMIIDHLGKSQTIRPVLSSINEGQSFLHFNLHDFESGSYYLVNDKISLKIIKK